MIDVTVVLLEEALPSTFIVPAEVFSTPGVLPNRIRGQSPDPFFRVRTASVRAEMTATGIGVAMRTSTAISAIRHTDLIVVGAIPLDIDTALARNAELLPWLTRWYERGAAIAGICSGVCILAEAGLLDGRPATTHWGLIER